MNKKIGCKALSIILSIAIANSTLVGCGNETSQESVKTEDIVEESVESLETDSSIDLEEAKKAEEEAKKVEEEAKKAEEEARKAEEEAKKAEEEAKAEEERLKAEAEAKKAEEDRIKAEEETKKAEEERLKAEAEAKKAEEEAKKAEEERLKAEAEAKKAEEERLKAEEEAENSLTPTQLTSINMLNYMTVLTQEINTSKGNQLYLESARTSLYNDTNLNAVDSDTQAQINQLVGTIDQYRMVDVKRNRLQFIYEQNQAQALRQAIPNPMGLLSAVQSGSILKAAASVVYMAVDSATSYQAATNQAELQFIKEGWELDDAETEALQKSTTAQFNYMCNMVRKYDLPDEYVVRDTDVMTFVEWSKKTNRVQKIDWLVANEKTYQKFGPYWLELAKDYYDLNDYKKCLEAVNQYEEIYAKITRKDDDYAKTLPMAIIAAKETKAKKEYIDIARKYCKAIVDNTKDGDWALRYFTAQIYLDLYAQTKDQADLKNAYDRAYYNVTVLLDEQKTLNNSYTSPIVEAKADKGANKRKKEEVKQYNKLIKEERKVAVPPVSEALYLNCDMLFAIAKEIGIDQKEKNKIDSLLHEGGSDLFLTKVLDNKFRYTSNVPPIKAEDVEVFFDGAEFMIPVTCICDKSQVSVTVNGNSKEKLDDWEISNVDRSKKSDYSAYTVTFKSKKGKAHKYQAGDKITITVIPVAESPNDTIVFSYDVVPVKKAFVINGVSFERK
ncbi:hypothetical protein [Butyrivibrio sp. FCS014]|uniref:hypothetical protein n=1 Tax=Butyrivibrio sp. FCS014 TaxID=1408304 RepID=UPI000465A133|nr:hypothetical protein [Butyrivibrio sp. FCS014]